MQQERERHDAGSASAGQDPHNSPRAEPREVIELEYGITVHPARSEGGRWRATWRENDERQQCEAAAEEKLAAKLEKVRIRLEADAPNMTKLGADLIAISRSRSPPCRQAVVPQTRTTALFTWKPDPTDVSCMGGHANVRTTLLMYVGTTVGILDRARAAPNDPLWDRCSFHVSEARLLTAVSGVRSSPSWVR